VISKQHVTELLKVENVTKFYGSHCAVENARFCLQAGELVALLGENGAGKSTTLQMIAGLLTPDHGTITIAGTVMTHRANSVKQMVGFLAEQPYLYPTLSGFEFLEFVGALYRLNKATCAKRSWELLERLH
jgi:ABC-2 type transport system ATP-binding protein